MSVGASSWEYTSPPASGNVLPSVHPPGAAQENALSLSLPLSLPPPPPSLSLSQFVCVRLCAVWASHARTRPMGNHRQNHNKEHALKHSVVFPTTYPLSTALSPLHPA